MSKLKEERKEKGKKQHEVAQEIGISTIMYSYIEQGRRRPSDEVKIKIANYYGKSVEYLFFTDNITHSD